MGDKVEIELSGVQSLIFRTQDHHHKANFLIGCFEEVQIKLTFSLIADAF